MEGHQHFPVKLPVYEGRVFPAGLEFFRVNGPLRGGIDDHQVSPAAMIQIAPFFRAAVKPTKESCGAGAHEGRKALEINAV